jgi:hypothetical protein
VRPCILKKLFTKNRGWWSGSRCRPWVQTLVLQKKKSQWGYTLKCAVFSSGCIHGQIWLSSCLSYFLGLHVFLVKQILWPPKKHKSKPGTYHPFKPNSNRIQIPPLTTFFFFFVGLGFEHKASLLQSRCSTSWVTIPVLRFPLFSTWKRSLKSGIDFRAQHCFPSRGGAMGLAPCRPQGLQLPGWVEHLDDA